MRFQALYFNNKAMSSIPITIKLYVAYGYVHTYVKRKLIKLNFERLKKCKVLSLVTLQVDLILLWTSNHVYAEIKFIP